MGARLQGRIAIVTGSTSGIGAGIARAFAAEGAKVVVSGRRRAEGNAVVESIRAAGGTAVFQETDLTRPEECVRLCHRAAEEFGGLDALVNNAGIFTRMAFEKTTPEFWDTMFNTNVRAAFLCSQAAVPLMRARGGGSITNIGSGNAFASTDRLFAYACSKGALHAMTRHLARIVAPQGIRVNWVTVGWVLTEKELEIQALDGRTPEVMREGAARLPMGAYCTVEEIAEGCVYLASDAAVHITGTDLNISAGLSIRL